VTAPGTAETDLAEIWAFIAQDSPRAASTFVRAIVHRTYAIYYHATDTEIVIVRVIHGARDAAAAFGQED